MSFREIVSPESIGLKLSSIWEDLAKTRKTRASLFNLLVYAHLDKKGDFSRRLVQKVVNKFPCRVFFIAINDKEKKEFLKTAISVVSTESEDSQFACDYIDIGVSLKSLHIVPYLILPHIVPDLPVYLLWTEDPSLDNPIFNSLSSYASRVIFDSESAENLSSFAAKAYSMHAKYKKDVADLNWARIEPWRDVIASQFCKKERIESLQELQSITIEYNNQPSDYFSHLDVQALYLSLWLLQRMGFPCNNVIKEKEKIILSGKKDTLSFDITIKPIQSTVFSPGSISLVTFLSKKEQLQLIRKEKDPGRVWVEISLEKKCEVPFSFVMEKQSSGFSLIKEISYKGSSEHYLEILHQIESLQL